MQKDLKKYLNDLYVLHKRKYSADDPVWILHEFSNPADIEIAGLITSCYCYGQIDRIKFHVNKFLNKIDFKVYEFTSNFSQQKDKKFLNDLNYRFNSSEDFCALIQNIQNAVDNFGSLQNLFLKKYDRMHSNVLPALTFFSRSLNKIASKHHSGSFLIPSPEAKSACKRLNLFLRWMVRKDEIDLGIWNNVDKSKLLMPVDTHIYRVSRRLKLLKRKSCDLNFAIELTDSLKRFDSADPVKYDFSLCHIDIAKKVNI